MIRDYKPDDSGILADIWLEASLRAHDFVAAEYWHDHLADMRDVYIPSCTNYVHLTEEGVITGFISLTDNHIQALFVDPRFQGRGYGKLLLDHAVRLHTKLTLAVYSENTASVQFYLKRGFKITGQKTDKNTGHPELLMEYDRTAQTGR